MLLCCCDSVFLCYYVSVLLWCRDSVLLCYYVSVLLCYCVGTIGLNDVAMVVIALNSVAVRRAAVFVCYRLP